MGKAANVVTSGPCSNTRQVLVKKNMLINLEIESFSVDSICGTVSKKKKTEATTQTAPAFSSPTIFVFSHRKSVRPPHKSLGSWRSYHKIERISDDAEGTCIPLCGMEDGWSGVRKITFDADQVEIEVSIFAVCTTVGNICIEGIKFGS